MGSVFGGAQTVPTTQGTNQILNQASAQQSQLAQNQSQETMANPAALNLGNLVSNAAGSVFAGFGNQPYPGLQIAPLSNTTLDLVGALGGYGVQEGGVMIPAGMSYWGQGANLLSQAPSFVNQGGNYLTQAGDIIGGAAQPITGEDVASFYNPFAENVTANLQDIFGQQNLANRVGATAQMGGVGGSRAAVGQALLARQQG